MYAYYRYATYYPLLGYLLLAVLYTRSPSVRRARQEPARRDQGAAPRAAPLPCTLYFMLGLVPYTLDLRP